MAKELEYLAPDDVVIIGLDTEDGEDSPLYDERIHLPLDEALVRNIMTYGVLVPILVRLEDTKHIVIDGRQRVRCAREAARRQLGAGEHGVKVPARVTRGYDDGRVKGIMISTNENRQADDVLAKAKKAAQLLDTVGDINEVAIAFGRTVTTIRNWLALLEAAPEIHNAVRAGTISPAAAVELASFDKSEQTEKLRLLTRGVLPQKVVPEAKAPKLEPEPSDAPPAPTDGETAPVEASSVEEGLEGLPVESGAESNPVAVAEAPQAKAKQPKKVTATAVKKLKQEGSAKARTTNKEGQQGIKRTWLRAALKTDASKALTPERRAVLMWFVSGEADDLDWFAEFAKEAQAQMGGAQ